MLKLYIKVDNLEIFMKKDRIEIEFDLEESELVMYFTDIGNH